MEYLKIRLAHDVSGSHCGGRLTKKFIHHERFFMVERSFFVVKDF
jgi:hypothetical protein